MSTWDGSVSSASFAVGSESAYFADIERREQQYNWIIAIIVSAAAIVLPAIYIWAAYSDGLLPHLSGRHYMHVGMNVACNLMCIMVAARTRGPLAHRLNTALVTLIMAHGLLILAVFLFRTYYSRTIVILGILASAGLATWVTMLVERIRPLRIGVIPQGVSDGHFMWLGPNASFVPSPRAPATNYDLVLVNWSVPVEPEWISFVSQAILSGCGTDHLAKYIEDRRGRVSTEHFRPTHVRDASTRRYRRIYKRALDLILVILALPFALVLTGIAALAVRYRMGSPVLFSQDRVGIGGRVFRMYKLRTMVNSKEQATGATSVNDNRITPLGAVLRRFRIDELPQLYNVLKGDMSIIGPRPEQPKLTEKYIASIPAFQYRNTMPPGLTGWAQVHAGYAANEEETREKLIYDLYYIKNASFMLDTLILLSTIRALLKGTSAR